MIDQILIKNNEAKKYLKEISLYDIDKKNINDLKAIMKKAICCKLMIQEDETNDIRKLVILSIKNQNHMYLPDKVINSTIEKYDCHQSSLVSQKKTLLILFIEKELGIHFSDEDAVKIKTVDDLLNTYILYKKIGG